MDYLPIQASSVPCERVFSSSAETDTKKRNRLGSDLMEALQILKYALKKDLNFTKDLLTPVEQLVNTNDEPELEVADSATKRVNIAGA
jgi:hypothetical protein